MRASRLRLLPVSAVIVAGAVITPVPAIAEPTTAASVQVTRAEAPVAQHPQVVTEDPAPSPPLWLLLLLAPVLVGGVVGVGVTLRRLR
jgi:hypothetical protein